VRTAREDARITDAVVFMVFMVFMGRKARAGKNGDWSGGCAELPLEKTKFRGAAHHETS